MLKKMIARKSKSFHFYRIFNLNYQFCREINDFKKKSEIYEEKHDKDVIDLRFKHYQGRLINTLNLVIEQRRVIKTE